MKLMLGAANKPELLVVVEQERDIDDFDFYVTNGNWQGVYYKGHITVLGAPSGAWSSIDKLEILTDKQDRLRHKAGEWREVFYNWNNPNYVAPLPKVVYNSYEDDDIPF